MFEIIKYNEMYQEDIKNLLVELQEYIVLIDEYKLNIITSEYREKYFEHTMEELDKNDGVMYLAKNNNNILGLICGYIQKYDDIEKIDYACPKKAIISELVVSKKMRSMGIGQKLIEKIEGHFKNLQCEYIQLDVFYYNNEAKRFYEKNNYKERVITMSKKL